jgi:hypothetical protein
MTNLAALIASRFKHQCDLCAVSIFLDFILFGLIACLHWGPA